MKELLAFLLLIFFIESKPILTPILKRNNGSPASPKENPTYQQNIDESIVKPTSTILFCEGGQIVAGFCKCPKGTKNYRGKCSVLPPVKCEGGIINGNKCSCPPKTKLIKGRCVNSFEYKMFKYNSKN